MNDVDVARDDLALDALAAGRLPENGDDVLGLLHALRTDLDSPAAAGPAPGTATAPAAATPAAATPAATTPAAATTVGLPVAGTTPHVVPLRPRRRPLALIALSAAAGLVLGGIAAGAVVTADEPGQLLYAAHKAVLGDPKAADRVTRLLDDAAEALAEGDRREARRRLDRAAERIGDVEDPRERAALAERLGRLRAIAAAPSATPSTTPSANPSATPSGDDDPTPEPSETESPDGDNSGKGSSSSGSGSGDGRSGSSGKGSGDVLETLDPDDSSGRGGGD